MRSPISIEGKGPAVIIGHCSSASHKEWLPLIETLKADWRVLAPDFIGYGQSSPGRPSDPLPSMPMSPCCSRSPRRPRGPLHLVGHSYGAALALEAARTLGSRVKSLTLVEPVSFHLLRSEGRPEWTEVETLAQAVLGPVAQGNDRAAAEPSCAYWLGPCAGGCRPSSFKTAIAATIHKVALEFTIAIDGRPRLQRLCEIATPTLLIAGGKTRAPTRAVVDILAQRCPMPKSACSRARDI